MRKPRRPCNNLEEYRLHHSFRRAHKWPCLGCNGIGRTIIYGIETGTCQTCKGSGKGTEKEVAEAYHKEIQAWQEEVKAFHEEIETVRRAINKLTPREFLALADYLTEEPWENHE